jgi:hypothetical protein
MRSVIAVGAVINVCSVAHLHPTPYELTAAHEVHEETKDTKILWAGDCDTS